MAAFTASVAQAADKKPNVVFILADAECPRRVVWPTFFDGSEYGYGLLIFCLSILLRRLSIYRTYCGGKRASHSVGHLVYCRHASAMGQLDCCSGGFVFCRILRLARRSRPVHTKTGSTRDTFSGNSSYAQWRDLRPQDIYPTCPDMLDGISCV